MCVSNPPVSGWIREDEGTDKLLDRTISDYSLRKSIRIFMNTESNKSTIYTIIPVNFIYRKIITRLK